MASNSYRLSFSSTRELIRFKVCVSLLEADVEAEDEESRAPCKLAKRFKICGGREVDVEGKADEVEDRYVVSSVRACYTQ